MKKLKKMGVPVLESLPVIESANETTLRSPEDVARRMLCLMLVSDMARNAGIDQGIQYLERNGLFEHLTPFERRFADGDDRSERTRMALSWRCEAVYLLMWVLGKFSDLHAPKTETDLDEIYPHLPAFDEKAADYIADCALIDRERILDQADLLYRIHWAVRQASIDGQDLEQLDADVVQEWHRAINWVTCYGGELDWEEVTTDT